MITRGDNDDELVDLVEFARGVDAEVRFIEYMDVGGATGWRPEAVVSRREMLARLSDHFGPIEPVVDRLVRAGGPVHASRAARPSASSPRRPSRSAARAIAPG